MTSAETRTPESVFKCGKAENYCDIKVLFKYLQAPLPQQQLDHSVALQCHKCIAATEHPPLEVEKYQYMLTLFI